MWPIRPFKAQAKILKKKIILDRIMSHCLMCELTLQLDEDTMSWRCWFILKNDTKCSSNSVGRAASLENMDKFWSGTFKFFLVLLSFEFLASHLYLFAFSINWCNWLFGAHGENIFHGTNSLCANMLHRANSPPVVANWGTNWKTEIKIFPYIFFCNCWNGIVGIVFFTVPWYTWK